MSEARYPLTIRPRSSVGESWWQLVALLFPIAVAYMGLRWSPLLAAEAAFFFAMLLLCIARPFTGALITVGLILGLDSVPIETGNERLTLTPFTTQTHFFHIMALSSRMQWLPFINMLQLFLLVAFGSWAIHRLRAGTLQWRGGALALPFGILALALFIALFRGTLRGGDLMMGRIEIHALLQLILTFLVMAHLIERPAQVRALIWTVIAAFALRAAVIWWNAGMLLHFDLSRVDTVTGHEDALFMLSLMLLWGLMGLFHTGAGQRRVLTLLLLPLLGAFILTKRRAALVVVPLLLPFLLFLLRGKQAQRAFATCLAVGVLLTLYTLGFRHSSGIVAMPLRLVESLSEVDASGRNASSNRYRLIESTLLLADIRDNAVLGKGFGQEYRTSGELLVLRQTGIDGRLFVGKVRSLRFVSHNQILWIWLKAGIGGFIAFWFAMVMAVAHGASLARTLKTPYFKALAALAVLAVCMQMVTSCFDMGLTGFRNMSYLGLLLAILVRLRPLEKSAEATG